MDAQTQAGQLQTLDSGVTLDGGSISAGCHMPVDVQRLSALCHMLLGLVVLLLAGDLLGIAVLIRLAVSKDAVDDGGSRHV